MGDNAMPALYHTCVWLVFLIFFVFACFVAKSLRMLRVSLVALAIVIGIISVCCLVEVVGGGLTQFRRLGFGEPLALAVPIFTALALGLRRRRAAVFFGTIAILAWLSILLLLERGAFLGATGALLLLAVAPLLNHQWRPRSWKRSIALGAIFCATVGLTTYYAPVEDTSVVSRLSTASRSETSTATRLVLWGIALEELREHPWRGVGANNYEVSYPEARAAFSRRYPDSPLISVNEYLLAERTHNEYLQILAELGVIGFAILATFAVALLLLMVRVVRHGNSFLALGACGSVIAFALTSAVTSASFRWTGSALIFFFAAALVTKFGTLKSAVPRSSISTPVAIYIKPLWIKRTAYASLALTTFLFCSFVIVAANQVLLGMAQSATSPERAAVLARKAYLFNPYDATTNFTLGAQMYGDGDSVRAVPFLRFATERGHNAVSCFALLAMAESAAGDGVTAEETLDHAVQVYPRSIFIRTRHAFALAATNRSYEAAQQLSFAETLDVRAARGWMELHKNGADAAALAARADANIAAPRELLPEDCVLLIASDHKKRGGILHTQKLEQSFLHH
jgi:O-antigen ligase